MNPMTHFETRPEARLEPLTHLEILRSELQRRRGSDPTFSLRAFARFLGIDAGSLSRIMNGKQDLSLRSAILIVRRLGYSGDESKRFLTSVADEKIREITEALAQASDGASAIDRGSSADHDGFQERIAMQRTDGLERAPTVTA